MKTWKQDSKSYKKVVLLCVINHLKILLRVVSCRISSANINNHSMRETVDKKDAYKYRDTLTGR